MEEKELPPKNAFYNVLSEMHIIDEDHNYVKKAFKTFECKSFADYLELCQNVGRIMLREVFLNFRRIEMQYYDLDSIHFITSADLTWNAELKVKKIELQLLSSITDYLWFKEGRSGGIYLLGKRLVQANNPEILETYDKKIPNNYIFLL